MAQNFTSSELFEIRQALELRIKSLNDSVKNPLYANKRRFHHDANVCTAVLSKVRGYEKELLIDYTLF